MPNFKVNNFFCRKKAEKRKNPPTKNNWTFRSADLYESLDDLKRRRPLVQPNSNFMRQLVKWEQDNSKKDIEPYNPYDFFSYQVLIFILSDNPV
jgi:hypothetical protein